MGLTKKQRVFIEEYLQCWNAAEAARRAGYSERTARNQASRLLAKANIQEEVQKRISDKAMSADEVLQRLVKQRTTITQKKDGDEEENHWIEVELHDAQAALVHLGRHHKLFTERQEITGKDGGGLRIEVEYVNSPVATSSIPSGPDEN
jgi:phage terminase small subunit